jgi:hypothetical protein
MARSTGFGSFAKRVAVGTAFIVAAGALAGSAWAGGGGPLTGVYEGKANCSGLQNGVAGKDKQEFTVKSPVLVTHGDTRATLEIPGLGAFVAFVENNTQKPGQSIVSGITCTLNGDLDGATIFVNAKVKGDNATLKGTLVILDDAENQSASCKISLKRFETSDPSAACPAL